MENKDPKSAGLPTGVSISDPYYDKDQFYDKWRAHGTVTLTDTREELREVRLEKTSDPNTYYTMEFTPPDEDRPVDVEVKTLNYDSEYPVSEQVQHRIYAIVQLHHRGNSVVPE